MDKDENIVKWIKMKTKTRVQDAENNVQGNRPC